MPFVDQFFLRFAPHIIVTSVLILHVLGYLITVILHGRYNLAIWSGVGVVDMFFGFRCGKLVQSFYKRVLYDTLTGAGNRALFYLKFPTDIRELAPTSILLFDLDNFKNINDIYGHSTGDKVLKEFVNILKQNIRVRDTVVRWGGEEFVLILPNTGEEESIKIAEKIRLAVEKAEIFNNTNDSIIKITTSIGVAICENTEDGNDVVNRADKALYKAKEKRNLVMTWKDYVSLEI